MKISTLIVLSLVLINPVQKAMSQTQKKPALLNHIAVHVADLAKATAFYATIFELVQIPEPFKDNRHTWFSLGAAGQMHLIQSPKTGAVHDKNEHLCFSVVSIPEFIQKLKSQKVAYGDWAGKADAITKRPDGIQQIYIQDPDGHWLEINDDQ